MSMWSRLARPAAAMAVGGAVSFTVFPRMQVHAAGDFKDFTAVATDIEDLLEDNEDMGPTLVRLGWHASGTFDCHSKEGGSDGARMRFDPEKGWGANAGLAVARDFLEPIKKGHPWISYADLWALAAVVAIRHEGGPTVPFRSGRTDCKDGSSSPKVCGLPDADKGEDNKTTAHVRHIFYRMGFNDREIVALMGAHALGRCHPENSGYDGPWTRAPTTFSNEFYRELIESTWTVKKGMPQIQYEEQTGSLMMLPADMALIKDDKFKFWTKEFAADETFFFREFAAAFQKLEELGCKGLHDAVY